MRLFVVPAFSCLLFLCAPAALQAQAFHITNTPLHVGESYNFTLLSGTPQQLYILAMDQDGGPVVIPGLGTVELSLLSSTFFAPLGTLDGTGSAVLSATIPVTPGMAGRHYHGQAVTYDPSAPLGWQLSLPWSGGVHPSAGTPTQSFTLTLGENTASVLSFGPGAFPFYGGNYTQVMVSSNGLITFGGPYIDPTEEALDMIMGLPKIAFLWDDLSPQLQGQVHADLGTDFLRIRFENLRQYNVADHNDASVTLYTNGAIMMEWFQVELEDGLVGLSPGAFLGSPQNVDFRSSTLGNNTGPGALFQQFWPGFAPFNLSQQTITFLPDPASGGYRWVR